MIVNRRTALHTLAGASAGLALPFGLSLFGRAEAFAIQALEPFHIDFGSEAIDDLHRRIDRVRWPEMPFDPGWSTGTSDGVLKELVDYWRNEYDWFVVQDELNRLDHRRALVDGERLHCVLYDGQGEGTIADFPLLLLHGWPGSFHEFGRSAGRLRAATSETPGFNLVVPSLPGFALSDAPRNPGVNPGVIAERLHSLMGQLGYERYGVQGGDWGAVIATQMALRHPDSLVGLHLNFIPGQLPPPDGVEPSAEEQAYREFRAHFQATETGYSAIQLTRPQSLAYAQQDSPVGWLAWMLEKYWAWTDHDENLWNTFTRDDVLTTAMLYWLPGRILSAARIYYETLNAAPGSLVAGRVDVPTGYARFPAEPWGPPREVAERSYNLVHYAEPTRGGHFPALEQPEIWSDEVSGFFAAL